MTREDLSTALASMARDLLAQPTVQATLERVVAHALRLVDGCTAAGILVIRGGDVESLAATDDLARRSDLLQGELGEGPCLDAAVRGRQSYLVEDMTTESRWPRYARRASELGIGSALGFLLFTEDENLGALNLYAPAPDAFGSRAERVGWLLASHAAVAFSAARTDAQLREAISTRQEIGEAMGILMERHKITEDEAFGRLRRASQDRNVKLREIAHEIATTGETGQG